MKLKRSLFIVCSIIVMLFTLSLNVKASGEVTVYAPLGASIRTTGKAGIKFEASIGLDQTYPEGSEHGFFVAKGVHAYEDVKEAASNGESKVNGNNLINQKLTGTNKKFSVVVVNFEGDTDEANIDRFTTDLTVLPYVKLSDGTYIFPEDLCTRNIGQVAKQTSESNGYLGNELINKIVDLVGGQYLQIDESLVNEEVNVYVKSGLTANRSKYFINGKYYENVKFYGDINEALQTEVNNPVISLLDEEYNEDIQITKEVKLIGNNAVINGTIYASGENIKITNLLFNNDITSTNALSSFLIQNSTFNNSVVSLSEVDGISLLDNKFINNNDKNVLFIETSKGSVNVSGNTFDTAKNGVVVNKLANIDSSSDYINITTNIFKGITAIAISLAHDDYSHTKSDEIIYKNITINNNTFDNVVKCLWYGAVDNSNATFNYNNIYCTGNYIVRGMYNNDTIDCSNNIYLDENGEVTAFDSSKFNTATYTASKNGNKCFDNIEDYFIAATNIKLDKMEVYYDGTEQEALVEMEEIADWEVTIT